MNSTTRHPLHYHTWKDIGGPLGLLLDSAFCAFVIFAALSMIVFAFFILLLDYITAPVLALLSKIQFTHRVSHAWATALIIRPRQVPQPLDVVADAFQFGLQRLAIIEFVMHAIEIERIEVIIVRHLNHVGVSNALQ
jgi:hypothetical protein